MEAIEEYEEDNIQITWTTVKAHSGDPGNYFDGDTTAVSWNKKSFNIRFAEY